MIERYTRPQVGRVWSDQNKLDKWLRVELPPSQARAAPRPPLTHTPTRHNQTPDTKPRIQSDPVPCSLFPVPFLP